MRCVGEWMLNGQVAQSMEDGRGAGWSSCVSLPSLSRQVGRDRSVHLIKWTPFNPFINRVLLMKLRCNLGWVWSAIKTKNKRVRNSLIIYCWFTQYIYYFALHNWNHTICLRGQNYLFLQYSFVRLNER
jgi:hypothetical protein